MRENCVFFDRRGRPKCTECGQGVDLCQCTDLNEAAFNRVSTPEGQFLAAVYAQTLLRSNEETHLFERLIADFGAVGLKLSNNDNHAQLDSDIRRALVDLASTLTVLATKGTPEYPYPAD